MQLRLVVIAVACLGLSAVATAAVAAPKNKGGKASKGIPSKASLVIPASKYRGPLVPRAPQIEQGDSEWVKGTLQSLQLDPLGRVKQLRLKSGSVLYELNFSGACDANKRLEIAKHPELVTAWDSARKVSLLVRRGPGNSPSFCVLSVGVAR